MQQVFLSDVELYYSDKKVNNQLGIIGEEYHHIRDVMRHKIDDEIYVTDGKGSIYKTKIDSIENKSIFVNIISNDFYENKLANITFCIPRLKSADRFEFALEKCVELGITNFIVFDSKRTVAKGEKLERWQKILSSAMKQSLRSWLPKVTYAKNVEQIHKLEGLKIILDQNTEQSLVQYIDSASCKLQTENCILLFGPEGGLSEDELRIENGGLRIRLTENRLRSETAIISAATELALRLTQ